MDVRVRLLALACLQRPSQVRDPLLRVGRDVGEAYKHPVLIGTAKVEQLLEFLARARVLTARLKLTRLAREKLTALLAVVSTSQLAYRTNDPNDSASAASG